MDRHCRAIVNICGALNGQLHVAKPVLVQLDALGGAESVGTGALNQEVRSWSECCA
jgi:hypothetical protein